MSEEQGSESVTSDEVPAPASPWAALREVREARGLSVLDVAQHLKLTPRQVEAMEAGDVAQLPGMAFAKGFVRNYTRFLDLDPAPLLAQLSVPREVSPQFETTPLGSMPGPGGWKFSALPALLVAGVLLALAIAGWHYSWFEQRDEQYVAEWMAQSAALTGGASTPDAEVLQPKVEVIVAAGSEPAMQASPVLASEPQAPAPAPLPAAAVSAPVAASVPAALVRASSSTAASSVVQLAPGSASSTAKAPSAPLAEKASSASASSLRAGDLRMRSLHFSFKTDSWVEIRDGSGTVIFSRLNPAGSQQEIKGLPPLDVVVGNAAQVEMSQDGRPVPLNIPANSTVARMRLP